jgi:hypothetical protein
MADPGSSQAARQQAVEALPGADLVLLVAGLAAVAAVCVRRTPSASHAEQMLRPGTIRAHAPFDD